MIEPSYIKVLCVDGIDELKTGEVYDGCLFHSHCHCSSGVWVIKGISKPSANLLFDCGNCGYIGRKTVPFDLMFISRRLIPLEDEALEEELAQQLMKEYVKEVVKKLKEVQTTEL